MIQKNIKSRIVNKHAIESDWLKATNFVPLQGELIIYDIEIDADGNTLVLPEGRTTPYTYERFKIGDGITNVNELPFANEHTHSEYITESELEGKGYLTEHQSIKTINGESLVGKGDITTSAIVGVEALPTENINTNIFYQCNSGKKITKAQLVMFENNEAIVAPPEACFIEIVDQLPEVGKMIINLETQAMYAYYLTTDDKVYGYCNNTDIAAELGFAIGWNNISVLMNPTVIYSLDEATDPQITYLLLTKQPQLFYNTNDSYERLATESELVDYKTIVEVSLLPSDGNTNSFYRKMGAVEEIAAVAQQAIVTEGVSLSIVDELLPTGKLFYSDGFYATYQRKDDKVYGYVSEDVASELNTTAGWYPIETCFKWIGMTDMYGGVITSLDEAIDAQKIYLLTVRGESEPNLYYYREFNGGSAQGELGVGYSEILKTETKVYHELMPETILNGPLNQSGAPTATPGDLFLIKFDNVDYEGKVKALDGAVYLGNLGILDFNYPNTGEPFLLFYYGDTLIIAPSDSNSHTIAIYSIEITINEEEKIHKIDPKYYDTGSTCEHEWVIENGLSTLLSAEQCVIKTFKYCKKCGATVVDHMITHTYEDEITDPTCTEQGYTTHICSSCGDSYMDTYVEPTGHTPAEAVRENEVAATCTTNGSYEDVVYCSVCKTELSRETKIISALGHTEEIISAVEPPSICDTGLTEGKKCSVCGIILEEQKLVPAQHSYVDGNCEHCGVTSNEYFTFTLSSNDTYSVKAKDINNLPNNIVIPSTYNGKAVTSIGDQAFYNCDSLVSVIIPDSVTSINWNAFASCDNLTSVVIPDSVTSIGSGAFWNCPSLTSVVIPNSVTFIGSQVFYRCHSLASVVIPDNVTSIGKEAFYECSSLTSVVIGNSVTTIGEKAFAWCNGIESIVIPDSVTSIGDDAFNACNSLTSVVIGNSVTTIGEKAFYYCKNLTSVTIPNSVTSIGNLAFSGCTSLTSVHIFDLTAWYNISFVNFYSNPLSYANNLYLDGELVTELVIPNDVTSIKDHAFAGCDSLTSVVIGNSVTHIGENAFNGCHSLASIVIPDNVTSIGDGAFSSCTSLTSIIIPDSVTSIGDSAFSYCSSLTSITIPDSVTSIGDRAFAYCSMLTSITIPDSVTSIGDGAFSDCLWLTINCEATEQPEGWNANWNSSNRPVVWGYTG